MRRISTQPLAKVRAEKSSWIDPTLASGDALAPSAAADLAWLGLPELSYECPEFRRPIVMRLCFDHGGMSTSQQLAMHFLQLALPAPGENRVLVQPTRVREPDKMHELPGLRT